MNLIYSNIKEVIRYRIVVQLSLFEIGLPFRHELVMIITNSLQGPTCKSSTDMPWYAKLVT